MQRQLIAGALIIVAALSAVVTFVAIEAFGDDGGGPASSAVAEATATPQGNDSPSIGASTGEDCLSAAEIYAAIRPAVVEILSRSGSASPFGLPQSGSGSGIVIDEVGHILTNNHVVDGADAIEVRFEDGTLVDAQLVGTDPTNDLAVVQVDPAGLDLTVAELGDSEALRVGDPVLAIGNPFNLEGTLTQGIVSGLERTFSSGGNTRPIRNMIQTDAPVNPGNSGGPLINCQGEVVGINTLIENPTGDNVNVGIAFAVSSAQAKQSLPDMLAGATVSHPWLGIAGQELTPALADQLGTDVDSGVYVTVVAPGSPADEAGLRGAFASQEEAAQSEETAPGGDVIVSVDGEEMSGIEELAAYLDTNKQPGDSVELGVVRDNDELSVEATLAQWPS
jgi:S1-C subfamily serine protease